MGICKDCIHFRRVRPPSQLLKQAVGTSDAEISKALSKIQEDEGQQRGHEAQTKSKKEMADDEVWDHRPLMSDYCGLREAEEVYLVAEVKNFAGRCPDFKLGRPRVQSCRDCVHRVPSTGDNTDLGMMMWQGQSADLNAMMGIKSQASGSHQSSYMQGVGPRIAFEVNAAYQSQGRMLEPPKYLDSCQYFSRENECAVCALQNPHNACPAWTPADGTGAAPPPGGRSAEASAGSAPTASAGRTGAPPGPGTAPQPASPGGLVSNLLELAAFFGGRPKSAPGGSPGPAAASPAPAQAAARPVNAAQWEVEIKNMWDGIRSGDFMASGRSFCKHPGAPLELSFDGTNLWIHGTLVGQCQYQAAALPEAQWVSLQDTQGQPLPLLIHRSGWRLFAKFLPVAGGPGQGG